MLKDVLPARFLRALDFLQMDKLNEIRLRVSFPTIVYYGGRYFLGENGLADSSKDALCATAQELNDIVYRACECSVYAHNEELKQGYITIAGGVRIGICGEVVVDNGTIKTVGKTTFIRDLAMQLSNKFISRNLLVVDERNEIAAVINGKPSLNIGQYADVYSGANKQYGIINGIRTMTPDVIILDELITAADLQAINYVAGCGVRFVATSHSSDIYDLQKKPLFREVLKDNLFDRFVVLSNRKGKGTLEGVWDKNYTCLYYG